MAAAVDPAVGCGKRAERMDGESGRDDQAAGAPVKVSAVYEGNMHDIARARELARSFLQRVRAVHGLPVSDRAMGTVQLVVSELVTNAFKYAPGPCLLDLELAEGHMRITVWDSELVLPVTRAPEPGRVGQHGLEIVMAVSHRFEVCREPIGKRTVATVPLTDSSGEAPAGHDP